MRQLLLIVTTVIFSFTLNSVFAAEIEVKMLNKDADGNKMVFEPMLIMAEKGDTVTFLPTEKGHMAASIKGMLPEGIKKFKGKEFKDTICNHPFLNLGYEIEIPMLEARFVTTEQGTGIVHCAPSHGPDDFNLCLNNGIKAIETVDDDGKYTKNVKLFEGIHIFKANAIVIEKLKEQKIYYQMEN